MFARTDPAGGGDPAVQRAALRSLERLGHQVRAARSGAEALALLQAEPSDLLVCDLVLPGMSGLDLVERAAQEHPQLRVPFVSGYSPELKRTDPYPLRAKPHTPEALGERAASLLVER